MRPRIASMIAAMALVAVPASTSTAGCAGPPSSEKGATATVAQPTQPPAPPQYPGQLLDLTNWYLTLPTGEEGDPDDVYQPELATYSGPWFQLNEARDAVVFTANAGGVTTPGSNYPRSELREMSGEEKASWSNTDGTHTLSTRQAVTKLPPVKAHVVTAQIHDAEDDVVEVRLEGEHLFAEYDDGNGEITIDPAYQLGTPYDLMITAAEGRIEICYNGELEAEIPKQGSGWYFKTGSYVQSNPERGEQPDAVGQVVTYTLRVEHSS